jgi:hypothetical protein
MNAKQWVHTLSLAGAFAMDGATSPAGPDDNDGSFDEWLRDFTARHNNRITRDRYMEELQRRWDRIDVQRRGYLTQDEADRVYGTAVPLTGSQVTSGYNDPNAVRH